MQTNLTLQDVENLTPEQQASVNLVLDGLREMATIMAIKLNEGKEVIVPETQLVH